MAAKDSKDLFKDLLLIQDNIKLNVKYILKEKFNFKKS